MTLPRVIVFDLGKVLLDFDYGRMAARMAGRSGISQEAIHALIDQSPLLHDLESGRISSQEFFLTIQARAGYLGDFCRFTREFGDIFDPIPEMIDLHRKLATAGFPTCIFSNTNDLAIAHIRERYPFFNGFTDYVLSYEHGCMKPHAKLYEVVEETTLFNGVDILYIDDRPENIEAGATRGWQTILQVNAKTTIDRIRAIGCLP
ncbi:MAG: HAD family phosphatase [Opitutaceae bacterium]|nr:HAD family phosphatase [Verrucomicrobiales bacterium]